MVVMYINVSWEESSGKNRARFNPDRPYSILEHGLPEDRLIRLYRTDDWGKLSASHPLYLTIRGFQVPYVVFENEDDVTTKRGEQLSKRLELVLGKLWELYERSS